VSYYRLSIKHNFLKIAIAVKTNLTKVRVYFAIRNDHVARMMHLDEDIILVR